MTKRIVPASLAEALSLRLDKGDGCWLWSGPTKQTGYGQIRFRHQRWLAHRLAFVLAFGEIPAGKCVCHRCDNPRCCRPDHLVLGDQADNISDRIERGRCARGSRHGQAKLTEADVIAMRAMFAADRAFSFAKAAVAFGVTKRTASQAIRGEMWCHVPGAVDVAKRGRATVVRGPTRAAAPIKQVVTARSATAARGANNVHAKLTPEIVREMRAKYAPGAYGCERIAREHGVSPSTVRAMLSGKTWWHVDPGWAPIGSGNDIICGTG